MGKKIHPINNFSITNLVPDGGGTKNFLIVAHRDLDGLISAYLLAVALKDKYGRIDVLFSQPFMAHNLRLFLAGHNCSSKYTGYALVDLAIDYSKPKTTRKLVSSLNTKIRYIFDHHAGWDGLIKSIDTGRIFDVYVEGEHISDKGGTHKIVLGDVCCCAQLIYDHFNMQEMECAYINDLLVVAGISDDLVFRKHYEGTREYGRFITFKNNTLEACLKQIKQCTDISDISTSSDKYDVAVLEAVELIKTAEEIYPGVGYLRITNDINLSTTVIYEQAYKEYQVFIIKELNPRQLRISYNIAHILPDLNLLTVFGLKSGNPRRIRLRGKNWTIYSIIDKLKPYIDTSSSICS